MIDVISKTDLEFALNQVWKNCVIDLTISDKLSLMDIYSQIVNKSNFEMLNFHNTRFCFFEEGPITALYYSGVLIEKESTEAFIVKYYTQRFCVIKSVSDVSKFIQTVHDYVCNRNLHFSQKPQVFRDHFYDYFN